MQYSIRQNRIQKTGLEIQVTHLLEPTYYSKCTELALFKFCNRKYISYAIKNTGEFMTFL